MAITDKLSAIADSIRSKSGYKSRMTLDDMNKIIKNINTEADEVKEHVTFNGMNSDIQKYMQDSEIYNTDDTVTVVPGRFENEFSDSPNKYEIYCPRGFLDSSNYDARSGKCMYSAHPHPLYSEYVKNQIPNYNVIYNLLGANLSIVSSRCVTTTGQIRMIDIGTDANDLHFFNIRDLGGWPCDHGTLKYGLLYRGCELEGPKYGFELTDSNKRILLDILGIKYEMDLRARNSDEEDPGDDGTYGTEDDADLYSVLGDDIGYFSLRSPGKFKNSYPGGISSLSGYGLSSSKQGYRMAVKQLADNIKNKVPTYIHCLAGADRTGTLCMLIEAICGVEKINLDRDYELTSFSKEWNKSTQNYDRNRRTRTINAFGSTGWPYMFEYLNNLNIPENAVKRGNNDISDTICGKVVYYLTSPTVLSSNRVTIDEINDIRKNLIYHGPHLPDITISY